MNDEFLPYKQADLFAEICELEEKDAWALINNVCLHYKWSGAMLGRTDAENVAGRDFTDEEWDRLSSTASWNWFVNDCISGVWVERLHNLMGDLGLLGDADG